MIADIILKDYYFSFVNSIKRDINIYQNEYNFYKESRVKQRDFLNDNGDKYKELFNIDVDDYDSMVERAERLILDETEPNRRFLLAQIIKLKNTNQKCREYSQMIAIAYKRKDIKYRDYEKYVFDYYDKVHKYMLQGFGYTYGFNIGTICICRWKIKDTGRFTLDYAATNQRKRELIDAGKKLYNANEAAWYKARNIPYDGIDYRIYKRDTHLYKFHIVDSKLFNNNAYTFTHANYINKKFKDMKFQEICDCCTTLDEICAMPIDVRYKLKMVLDKDPASYILFIRNSEQDFYKYGAHNSQD